MNKHNKTETEFIYNLAQELTYGTAKRFPEFFVGPIKYEYNSQMGFSGENNFELLKECIGFLREQGYNVLVRNSSSLGFPTVQVIVPGYSETFLHRLSKGKDDNRYLSHAVKTLRNPAMATPSSLRPVAAEVISAVIRQNRAMMGSDISVKRRPVTMQPMPPKLPKNPRRSAAMRTCF